MSVQQYIETRLTAALDILESGVQMQNAKEVQIALATLQSLEGIVGMKPRAEQGETTTGGYESQIREGVVRACSAMCILDRKNALRFLQIGTKYDGKNKILLNNYGFCYWQEQQWEKSIDAYRECLEIDSTYTVAYLGLSSVYLALRQHDKELSVCREGLSNCPSSPELYNSFGLALLHASNTKENIFDSHAVFDSFRMGIDLRPEPATLAKLLVNTGHVHGLLGDFPLAVKHYLDAIEADPDHSIAYHNILSNLSNFSDSDVTRSAILRRLLTKFDMPRTGSMSYLSSSLHVKLCDKVFGPLYNRAITYPKAVEQEQEPAKIRVGYLVADPSGSHLNCCIRHLWEKRNPHGFLVFVYFNSITSSCTTPSVQFTSTSDKTAEQVAQQIIHDNIDILVELNGHMAGNRLDVMALRPARILLSYLGYPGVTGVRHVRRVSDRFCESKVIAHEDTVIGLSSGRSLFAYSGPSLSIQDKLSQHFKSFSRFKPGSSAVTFGCFAKLSKINAAVITTWKILLSRFSRGHLVLKSAYFADPEVRATWKEKFGVALQQRITLLQEADTEEQRMAMYSMIDVHLDTFPSSDFISTLESLYMNVPVITVSPRQKDATNVQRSSGSVLHACGLADACVAENLSDYVRKAIDIVQLFQHISVRKAFLRSPVCNVDSFMKEYESMLIDIFV